MTRKFNVGRQSEIALNKEWHDLFMALRSLNNGSATPAQDKQTPIPSGAIWNDTNKGQNVLKINKTGEWVPAFQGYYHPASLKEKPLYPVDGQMWIDSEQDNTLKCYDQNTDSWIAVKSVQTNASNVLVDTHNNYINMTKLKDMDSISGQKTFLVPYTNHGKLFDNGVYIHSSDSKYENLSDVSVKYTTATETETQSWIHVNANKLFKIEKRLIKINKTGNTPYQVHGLFDNNTEFYYVDANGLGVAMIPYAVAAANYDYKSFEKGIEITSTAAKNANFIYSVSYVFHDTPRPGKLVRKDFTIGNKSEVHVGQLTKRPMIFLDGLYLEQSQYEYNASSGNVSINDTVINSMDMMAVVFQDLEATGEKAINNITGPGTDTIVGTFTNAINFKKPLAFVSGVMGTNIVSPEEISFEGDSLVIKNFGPGVISPCKVMVVEADNMYLGHGTLDKEGSILNNGITTNLDDEYVVFVDGILASSKDLEVSSGQIKIMNSSKGQQYVLLKIIDHETTALSFDNKIHNFTIAITNQDGSLYNECNDALVFSDGKFVATNDMLYKSSLPIRGTTGQIVSIKEDMYIWNDEINKWEAITPSLIAEIKSFMKADYTNGSIMLDSTGLENKKGTYYAYTFANGVEEPLLKGTRKLVENKTEYAVNVEHSFTTGQGALSVYVDKLLSPFVYEESSNTGKFIVPTLEASEGVNPYENAEAVYYIERVEKTESVACSRQVLTAADRNTDYAGAYNTTISLVPGVVHLYLNGVRLDRKDFTIINENTFVLHKEVVGNQKNYNPEDQSTWNKFLLFTKEGTVEIDCDRDDYIIVEVRQDYNLKSQSIPVRYAGQTSFYIEDDGIPKSLILTQDLIKIYIDGILYTGEYYINRDNGSITLMDTDLGSILNIDPIARHFSLNPDDHDRYIKEYGSAYIAKPETNIITFEWR